MPRQTRGMAALCGKDGDIVRRVAMTEARKMESTGEVVAICRHCSTSNKQTKRCTGYGKVHDFVYMLTALYRNIHSSQATLGFSDMLANVGQSTKGERDHAISPGYAAAIREKVGKWLEVHDDLAPLTNSVRATDVPDVQYSHTDGHLVGELVSPLPCNAANLEAGFAGMGPCSAG